MGVSKGWKQAAGYFAGRRPAGQEDSSSSTQQPESYPNGSMSNRTFRDQGNSRNSIQYPELPYKAPDDSGHEVPVLGADTPWSDDPRMDNENRLGTINAPEMPRAGASSPKLRQQIKDMNDYLKHVGAQHERDQKALKLAHGTETEKLTTILRDRDREIALLKKNIQQTATDAGRLRTELQAAKNDVEQGRRRAAQDLENKTRTLKKDLAIAKDDNSRIEQRLKSEHSVVVASLNTEMQRVTSVASRDAENMSQQHKRAVEDIKLQHRTDLSRKDEEHERNVRKLRSEVEELNEAWLTRDEETFQAEIFSTKGILSETDGKLRERVVELQRMIDDLSSTAWKPEQEGMERVLKSMGSGQHSERALKKAIVQDVIWSTLFRWIFCSPFRMFGEEGKKLEAEWNDACGKGAYLIVLKQSARTFLIDYRRVLRQRFVHMALTSHQNRALALHDDERMPRNFDDSNTAITCRSTSKSEEGVQRDTRRSNIGIGR